MDTSSYQWVNFFLMVLALEGHVIEQSFLPHFMFSDTNLGNTLCCMMAHYGLRITQAPKKVGCTPETPPGTGEGQLRWMSHWQAPDGCREGMRGEPGISLRLC